MEESLLAKNPLLMPLHVPAPKAAPPASDEAAVLEPPGLLDRPLVAIAEDAARRALAPGLSLVRWAEAAWKRLSSKASRPVALVAGLALVWLLAKALGTLVQLLAVGVAAYVAIGVMRR